MGFRVCRYRSFRNLYGYHKVYYKVTITYVYNIWEFQANGLMGASEDDGTLKPKCYDPYRMLCGCRGKVCLVC